MAHETLTDAERKTLDAAEQILARLMRDKKETLMLSIHGGWESLSTTYFTPGGIQHGSLWRANATTLGGKVQVALDLRAAEADDLEKVKAARVERLREELTRLTGETA